MNLQACTINATLQLVKVHKIQSHFICRSHWNISINFNTYNSFYIGLEKHLTCSTETHGNVVFPHKVRKEKVWEPEGELIRLSDVISQDQNNDKTDLSSSTKNTFHRITTTKISKSKSISFQQNHFVSVKPSVTCAEASWPVLEFWCSSLQIKPTQQQQDNDNNKMTSTTTTTTTR